MQIMTCVYTVHGPEYTSDVPDLICKPKIVQQLILIPKRHIFHFVRWGPLFSVSLDFQEVRRR